MKGEAEDTQTKGHGFSLIEHCLLDGMYVKLQNRNEASYPNPIVINSINQGPWSSGYTEDTHQPSYIVY